MLVSEVKVIASREILRHVDSKLMARWKHDLETVQTLE